MDTYEADAASIFLNAQEVGSPGWNACIDHYNDEYPDDRTEFFIQEAMNKVPQTTLATTFAHTSEMKAQSTKTVSGDEDDNQEEYAHDEEKEDEEKLPSVDTSTKCGLSAYEQKRLDNIAKNKEVLEILGLGQTLVQQNTVKQAKKPRKKHEKKVYDKKHLPKRSTRSNVSYSDAFAYDDEQKETKKQRKAPQVFAELPRSTRPKRAPVNVGEVCNLKYSEFPDWFREKNPLNEGRNASGYLYVHKVQSGYQVQIHVTFDNGTKRLVHHGIFEDIKTAALAQAVASADSRVGKTSLGGRHLLESIMTASARAEASNSDEDSDNLECSDGDDGDEDPDFVG
jgi:hypothetical protein